MKKAASSQASPSSPSLLLSDTFVSGETKVQRVCPSLFGMASHTKQDIQWGQEERKQPAEKGGLSVEEKVKLHRAMGSSGYSGTLRGPPHCIISDSSTSGQASGHQSGSCLWVPLAPTNPGRSPSPSGPLPISPRNQPLSRTLGVGVPQVENQTLAILLLQPERSRTLRPCLWPQEADLLPPKTDTYDLDEALGKALFLSCPDLADQQSQLRPFPQKTLAHEGTWSLNPDKTPVLSSGRLGELVSSWWGPPTAGPI